MHVATAVKAALKEGGVGPRWPIFFTDKRKDGTSRTKLWYGDSLFAASQRQQRAVDKELRGRLGDRFVTAYFIESSPRLGGKAFCVVTKTASW